MSEELSEYELERLTRMRENHAKLVALGLAKDEDSPDCVLLNCKKKKSKTSSDDTAKEVKEDIVVPPSSRVLRSKSTNEHVQLSDAFSQLEEADMAEEERAERRAKMLSRPGKRVSRPPSFWADTQAEEINAKLRNIEEKQVRLLQEAAARAAAERRAHASSVDGGNPANNNQSSFGYSMPLPPVMQPVRTMPQAYDRADRNAYFTQGQKAKCPHCNGVYVLKRNGMMRAHTCVPFSMMDAAELLPNLG